MARSPGLDARLPHYHAVVAGLGAMGSAAAYHLARRGMRVVGVDRFAPPHAHGSSHGESRIIREAYFEHPAYVPLVQRALELWEELEAETGRALLVRTGALMVGPAEGELIRGTLRSVETHRLPHQRLSGEEIERRFPAFRGADDVVGVHEPRAGVLDPEGCVGAHLEAARSCGAELRFGEAVTSWRAEGGGVEVTTERARYRADHLILSVGPWLTELLPELPLEVERQVTLWFAPRREPDAVRAGRFPAFIWQTRPEIFFYGIPDLGSGVKIARHHGGETGRLGSLDATVRPADVDAVRPFLDRHLPDVAAEPLRGAVCRYTNTPSGHFLLDRHPELEQVTIASPCSGHGFKFSSVVGEWAAARIAGEPDRLDFSLFRIGGEGVKG